MKNVRIKTTPGNTRRRDDSGSVSGGRQCGKSNPAIGDSRLTHHQRTRLRNQTKSVIPELTVEMSQVSYGSGAPQKNKHRNKNSRTRSRETGGPPLSRRLRKNRQQQNE